ncbi:toll/interleukin-1 receptor-like protein isoform X2 [Cryptomeria japonica]|uniref:toll/interleukin-1 receptor-like protein isoform X2 n=1 Tax=Cryptomeria japonica TaxID=3369 RepID=UPI0027DA5AC8|nr:toll/interleukin-1 receptor-like protein isoform X2 [Cryptomeria japonica]
MGSFFSSHGRSSFSDFERETPAVCKKIYDAFISHRGPDAKATVAFALYEALEEKGFWTFLDEQELQLGDSITSAIQDAIYSSKVQIAIFSPRYAESCWCLDELVDMLKTKALLIPIFYGVKPFELRYLDKGCYADAFAKHQLYEKRFGKDKIDQWKEALQSSADKSGYEFSTSNGIGSDVERLCTEIALAVQQEIGKTFKGVGKHQKGLNADEAASTSTSAMLKKSSLLHRDSGTVGIHSKVEHMVGLLEDAEVQVIAVVGMGGSVKTFLLQNVYESVKSLYF